MTTVAVIKHVPYEDLGNLTEHLKSLNFQIEYYDFQDIGEIDPLECDLLISLGGPMGVYQVDEYPKLKHEVALIKQRIDSGKATLGICLGAQLIAHALGQDVYPGDKREIGWSKIHITEDGLMSPLKYFNGVDVLHWHGDTFKLPDNSVHLASTAHYQNQAFQFKKHVMALQFHPEVTAEGLELWYPANKPELNKLGISIPSLREQAHTYSDKLSEASKKFLTEWLNSMRL